MATTIKHLKVGGTTYDIGATTADSMGEANLTWGGKNYTGTYGPLDAALNPLLSANRLAGMAPAGITVEYSTNGGSSWSTYSLSDAQKTALVTTSTSLRIGGPSASQSANSQLRITLDGVSGGVYTQLKKLHIYLSTSYSNGTTVTMESYDYNNSTSWHSILTSAVAGWSGWNVLNFTLPGSSAFGGTNDNNHQRKIRLTFKQTGITSGHESAGMTIYKIYGYGGMGWSTPSNLAAHGTPYSYDEQLNVTFPKQVTATKFNGNATGLVDAGNGNTITANYSAAAMAYDDFQYLTIWNGYTLKAVEKTDFVRNTAGASGSVGSLTNPVFINNGVATACTYTLGKSVPSNAVFTDHTYTVATASTAGLVKPVSVITKPTINSVTTTSGKYYSVQMSSDGAMFVNVPWSDSNTNYYHTSGSWSGLTYTATANGGAGALAFTLPTGTTSTTVAVGNHTHSGYAATSGATFTGAVTINAGVNLKFNKIQAPTSSGGSTYGNGSSGQVLKSNGTTVYWAADNNSDSDSKTSSSNTTSKIYLVGPTSQSSSGQTTYSNSSCYASGGYLYSNGVKVDMSNVGIEWGTF